MTDDRKRHLKHRQLKQPDPHMYHLGNMISSKNLEIYRPSSGRYHKNQDKFVKHSYPQIIRAMRYTEITATVGAVGITSETPRSGYSNSNQSRPFITLNYPFCLAFSLSKRLEISAHWRHSAPFVPQRAY